MHAVFAEAGNGAIGFPMQPDLNGAVVVAEIESA
jgi:hypothetical protein